MYKGLDIMQGNSIMNVKRVLHYSWRKAMNFNKADEMEMAISYKSARLAYVFVTISLIVWMIVDFVQNGKFPFIQFTIIAIQNIIFFGSKIYLTKKMTSDSNEK